MSELSTPIIRKLFNDVCTRVDEILVAEGKPSLSNHRQGNKSHVIAETINLFVMDSHVEGSTIQQNLIYSLQKTRDEKFHISDKYVRALRRFLELTEGYAERKPKMRVSTQQPYVALKPEFPEDNPSFPASPHYQLPIPGYKKVWIKDESFNPTGTHKDRKAQELLIYLQDLIRASHDTDRDSGRRRPIQHPAVSIISSGNEAYAIQSLFAKKNYAPLKVILDSSYRRSQIESDLKSVRCEISFADLSKELTSSDVKRITNNLDGHDFTTHLNEDLVKKRYKFYDWLSFEILNLSPDFCFIPAGTGDLYLNVLEFNKLEIEKSANGETRDNRFFGHIDKLCQCNFIGASTQNPDSKATKLFTQYNSPLSLPFRNHVKSFVDEGYCGKLTDVYTLDENYLEVAMDYYKKLKITAEPSGAAGLAMFFSMMENIPPEKTIVIVNTGKLRSVEDIEKQESTIKSIMEKVKKLNKNKI